MCREKTRDEIRKEFLEMLASHVWYWDTQVTGKTAREKMTGLVHSILATIDGCSAGLPGFLMIPSPHESDRQYHIENEENWYPQPPKECDSACDIGGGLHEVWHQYCKD